MNEIEARRNEAFSAYEQYYARDLIADEANKFAALQAGMLAEIALQLAGINEKLNATARALANISENLEFLNRTADVHNRKDSDFWDDAEAAYEEEDIKREIAYDRERELDEGLQW